MLFAAVIVIAAYGLAAVFVPIGWMLRRGRSARSSAPARASRQTATATPTHMHEHERARTRPQAPAIQIAA